MCTNPASYLMNPSSLCQKTFAASLRTSTNDRITKRPESLAKTIGKPHLRIICLHLASVNEVLRMRTKHAKNFKGP